MTRAWLAAAAVLCACASNPYESYRAAHPEWNGEFPTADADVSRVIAAFHAPGRGFAVTVTQLLAWRIDAAAWTPVDPAQATARENYALVASLHCASNDGTTQFVRGVVVWYLLPQNRLTAWDHYAFKPGCDLGGAFEPARGAEVAAERELVEKVQLPRPAQATGSADAYQKGRAFLRAGRRDDATAMLALGDSSGEGGFDTRARFNTPHRADEVSSSDARAALVRELGGAP